MTASSGRSKPHQRRPFAPAQERHRRGEQAQRPHAARRLQPDLERDPAAHRVADQVGAVDRQRVHEAQHVAGEELGVVGSAERLGGGAEAGQVDRVHRVLGRQRGDGLIEGALGAAEAVDQDHVLLAAAGGEAGDPRPAHPHVVDPQQRRAVVGEPEEALEADRLVEVAAGPEAALLRRRRGPTSAPRAGPARCRSRCRSRRRAAAGPRWRPCSAPGSARPPSCGRRRRGGSGRSPRGPPRRPDSARAASRMPPAPDAAGGAWTTCLPSAGANPSRRPRRPTPGTGGRPPQARAQTRVRPRARDADPRHPERGARRPSRRRGGRASTPAGRRSTAGSTSATPAPLSSFPCSHGFFAIRGTRFGWSSTSPTSTTRSTTPRGKPISPRTSSPTR